MRFLTSVFFLFYSISAVCQVDTIRQYNTESKKLPYRNKTALWYMARIDLPGPGSLRAVRLMLDGTGEGELRIFGHEAGSPYAELEKDLIPPITFEKLEDNGPQFIDIEFEDSIWLDGNQMFVAIDIKGSNLTLMRDRNTRASTCKSSSGGEYFPTVLAVPGNHQFYEHLWSVISYPLVVDLIYEPREKQSRNYFVDVTESAGLPTDLSNKSIAWADYNSDGFLDLLVAGRLFKNNGYSKTFTEVTSDLNFLGAARANLFADINNDGYPDIILFHTENHLYLNDGKGGFSHSKLNMPEFKSISSFNLGDVNGDDLPDLFVGQLWGTYPVPMNNYLYLNDGKGGFIDATKRIYPSYDGNFNYPGNTECDPSNSATFLSNGNRARRSRGSQFIDFDNDGDLDLYITNYFLETDEFYENDGKGNFTNIISAKGIDKNATGSNHGTGVDWYDYDNDGDFDLLLSQFAHPWGKKNFDHAGTTIYQNDGAPDFKFTMIDNEASGIAYEETHAGSAWGDANNDGLVDIMTTTYYGCRYVDFYLQNEENKYQSRTYMWGLENTVTGEDAAWVDYDNDGRLDLCLGENGRFRLRKNNADIYDQNWVEIDLEHSGSNIGAIVKIEANGNTYTQQVGIGRGQRMQKPARLHFGLGKGISTISATVIWPNGTQQEFSSLTTNKIHLLKSTGEKSTGLINDKIEQSPLFFPNPAQNEISVLNTQELIIYNLQGVELIHLENPKSVQLQKFSRGIYIMELKNGKTRSVERLIIE
jgi:hypothetical protein